MKNFVLVITLIAVVRNFEVVPDKFQYGCSVIVIVVTSGLGNYTIVITASSNRYGSVLGKYMS
jgi:hypothetical protein